MLDAQNRTIDYLRVSITDRCNLRCKYCMPEDLPFIPHKDILRYEELLRICSVSARLGIKNVKVTGGEPLARKGCLGFLRELKAVPGIEHVTITTNGVLLAEYVDALADMGLDGVNISLDTLNADIFQSLTGRDELEGVLRALYTAIDAGMCVKLNCVLIRGINEGDILPLAELAERYPVSVRFIELMPSSSSQAFKRLPADEVLKLLQMRYPDLSPDKSRSGAGPARYFKSGMLQGRVGLIDAITHNFCGACNRVRITSVGFLKLCLYHGDGLDLRRLLRGGATDAELEYAMRTAILGKPQRHAFVSAYGVGIGNMSRIGG